MRTKNSMNQEHINNFHGNLKVPRIKFNSKAFKDT